MQRRTFIRLVGGGTVAAAAAGAASWTLRADYPAESVQAWLGPQDEADPRRRAIAHAITAPNPHNLQPWLVDLREPGAITLLTDPQRVLPETDPFGRQILIGHGAFLELLVIALAQDGIAAKVTLWPQGELPPNLAGWDRRPVARLDLTQGASPSPLFAQVLRRHTPKVDFDMRRPVAPALLDAMLAAHEGADVRAGGTLEEARLPELRELCWKSWQVELTTARTVMESVRLTRVGPAEILRHRDGISLNNAMPRIADGLGLFDRTQPPQPGSPASDQVLARGRGHSRTAMGFVWLSTPGNTRPRQVAAGRAYVRLQLKATELGVGVHPMSQGLQEFAEMRPHFEAAHRLVLDQPSPRGPGDATLQMLCRIGYPVATVHATPRRPLDAFIG